MNCVSGKIYTKDGFVEGHITFENGTILDVCDGPAGKCDAEGLILPGFVNAHTHISDYTVPVDLSLSLEELVAPPNGLKYRALRDMPHETLLNTVKYLSEFMFERGITSYIDFREGGTEGAGVRSGGAEAVVLGKPSSINELTELISISDGFAPSSISDWDYGYLMKMSETARSCGKLFGIHCSERVREDIGAVLDLKPSFIVHMNKASKEDLEACADEKIPIVSCPRSNMFFGYEPPLKDMLDAGVEISLGTDNAMISMPDVLCEAEFAARLLRKQGITNLDNVITMIASNGRKIINHKQEIWIKSGDSCNFTVLDDMGGDPVTDVVLRHSGIPPVMVCSKNNIWRRGTK